jgi:hypothetical protein
MKRGIWTSLVLVVAALGSGARYVCGQVGSAAAPPSDCWKRQANFCCQSLTGYYQKNCFGTICTMSIVHNNLFYDQVASYSGWSWDTVSPDCGPTWCEFYPVQCGTPQQPCVWLDSTTIIYCICHGYPGSPNCGPVIP